MPSIHKNPKSKYFHASFIDATGRRVARSTKQTTRAEAWRVALAYEDAARAARHGSLTAAQMRKVITATVKGLTGTAPILHTIEDWCRSWAADKAITKSVGTAKRYGPEVEQFLAYLGSRAKLDICQLNKVHVQGYRDQKIKDGLSPSSINLAIKMLRTCLNVAIRQELITTNPAMAVDLLPKSSSNKRPFTRDEVRKLLAVATDDEWIGLIKVGYYVGCRIGNGARLCWDEIDFDQEILTYIPIKQKGDREPKTLEIPLHPELIDYLKTHQKESGPVFPKLSKMRVGGLTGLSLTFRSLIEKAGITCKVKAGKGAKGRKVYSVGYHSLRYSFNSDLANLGVSQEVRQKLIGHASEAVNDGYTKVERKTFRDAIHKLPSLQPSK